MSILLLVAGHAGARDAWQSALASALPGETFLTQRDAEADAGIDVAVVADPPPGALAGLPELRLVQSLWAGVEGLVADPTVPSHVPLARMVDPAMAAAMAETALWATLCLHRGYYAYARRQREALWRQHAQLLAAEIPVVVLGLGAIGGTVAQRLASNGYPVRGWSARPAAIDGIDCRHGEAALDPLLAAAEVVIDLLPLTPATRGLFDAARFSRMRRGAGFVNLARGAHVIEADLLAALDAGQLGHAVLDVFATEPLPRDHVFWRHPRVTVLPHAAALTDVRSASQVAARNVRALRDGRPLEHLVDRTRGY